MESDKLKEQNYTAMFPIGSDVSKKCWGAKIKQEVQDWVDSGEQVRALTFEIYNIVEEEIAIREAHGFARAVDMLKTQGPLGEFAADWLVEQSKEKK